MLGLWPHKRHRRLISDAAIKLVSQLEITATSKPIKVDLKEREIVIDREGGINTYVARSYAATISSTIQQTHSCNTKQ